MSPKIQKRILRSSRTNPYELSSSEIEIKMEPVEMNEVDFIENVKNVKKPLPDYLEPDLDGKYVIYSIFLIRNSFFFFITCIFLLS